ncbi:MAG TPA: glycosyltransferase, partial [Thermodesulfobacteriota bacterium]|nr:glycosyltransferase [Thermodesulfobacteriota bacterium]
DLEERVLHWSPSTITVRLEDITLLPDQDGDEPAGDHADEPVVMYMGNLERYQGIDLLLEAFQLVSSRTPEACLVIIGGSDSDIARYQKTARAMGIEGKTSFLGPKPLSEMRSHFNKARILVSPRIQGRNTPMKIYSYLDSGKPLLATNLPTHTQVLDPEIAYLVPPTAEGMAEGIEVLLKGKDLRETLARRAKERVRQEYCFEAYQRKLINFYAQIESKIVAHEGRTL